MIIRQETTDDQKGIFEIISQAFGQQDEAILVDLLRKSDEYIPTLSLVAVINNTIVGHILFSKIKIISDDGHEFDSLSLAPLAIKPEFQNRGFGRKLIKHGLEKAIALGYSSVIVLGYQDYYPQFGFTPAINWNIKSSFDFKSDHLMALELKPLGLKDVHGSVKYSKAFESL